MSNCSSWVALLVLSVLCCDVAGASDSRTGAWTPLFNGRDLDGWVQRGGKAPFRVENGILIGTSITNTPNSFLCTTRDYTNFVLELDFRVQPGLNSGVQVRSHCLSDVAEFDWKGRHIRVPAGRVHGLQVEIDPSTRAWSAGIHEEGGRGWLNDLKANEEARKAFKPAAWNHLRIECEGDRTRTWINGVAAADLKDSRVNAGFIAVQVHSVGRNGKPGLRVEFREMRLKEL